MNQDGIYIVLNYPPTPNQLFKYSTQPQIQKLIQNQCYSAKSKSVLLHQWATGNWDIWVKTPFCYYIILPEKNKVFNHISMKEEENILKIHVVCLRSHWSATGDNLWH